MRRVFIFLFVSLMAVPCPAQDRKAIAVLDLKARGLEKSAAENITDIVIKEVDRAGSINLVDSATFRF